MSPRGSEGAREPSAAQVSSVARSPERSSSRGAICCDPYQGTSFDALAPHVTGRGPALLSVSRLLVGVVVVLLIATTPVRAQTETDAAEMDELEREAGDEVTLPTRIQPAATTGVAPSFEQVLGRSVGAHFLGAGIGAALGFGIGWSARSCDGDVLCAMTGAFIGMMIAIPTGALLGAALGAWIYGESTDAAGNFFAGLLAGLAALAAPALIGLAVGAGIGQLIAGFLPGLVVGTILLPFSTTLGYHASRPARSGIALAPGHLCVTF